MQKILEARIRNIEELKDEKHVRIAVLGLLRITLQHACVCLGEWIAVTLREDSSKLKDFTGVDFRDFSSPSDGALINLLSDLLVAVENFGWRSAGRQYWEQSLLTDDLRRLVKAPKANVESILYAFVRERNNGAEGHGLPGGYDRSTDIAVIRALVSKTASFLPQAGKDKQTLTLPASGGHAANEIRTLKLFEGDPICYRRIKPTSAGRVKIDAQIQRTVLKRDDIVYEAPNILLELPLRISPDYRIEEPAWEEKWAPWVLIPDRITTKQEFTGRSGELNALEEWADDDDSRRCMIYGDGGAGKTTLVIEFLHRFLEGNTRVNWRPEIITFYTAKKTRWGIDGLDHISAQDIGVADVAVEIARMLSTEQLDRSWYQKSPKEVIQKLASLQAELGIERNQHLIILDNTETMTQSDSDVSQLADQINELSKRIGRVILTSRRREQIEAKPIEAGCWTEAEGAEFLRKRGQTLNCQNITNAGAATLRKYSRVLSNKPLALEVFAQAAASPDASLEKSFQRVQQMQRQDLGHFLYDDAWARLAPEMRHVLLLMSRLGDTVDQYMIQLCCRKADVSLTSASEAIEESKGIGTISHIQGTLQVAFSPEFFNYCQERTEVIGSVTRPTDEEVDWVRRRYSEFIASASVQVRDRHTRAFRVPSARAAWKRFSDGDFDLAFDFYETACSEDPDNGFLYDRYAYSLFTQRNYELALTKATRATMLLPDEPEAWFTRGMIEGRLGRVNEAAKHLDRSESLGKPKHLCQLQKAYAQVYTNPVDWEGARDSVEKALKNAPKDRFLDRFTSEATAFQRKWLHNK